jgi:hypothetical protein
MEQNRLDKLALAHLVNIFRTCHATRRFVAAFTRARQRSPFLIRIFGPFVVHLHPVAHCYFTYEHNKKEQQSPQTSINT